MPASFVGVTPMTGFDASSNPPWQMVPCGGSRRIRLLNGSGLKIASSAAATVTVSELAGPFLNGVREFEIKGVLKGGAFIEARDASGNLQARLEVSSKARKAVKMAFNFVSDGNGHHTSRHMASVDGWIKVMNSIFEPQVNVCIVKHKVGKVQVSDNLGKVVRFSAHLPKVSKKQHEWNKVIAVGDATADFNIFFVWAYEQDSTPFTDDTQAGTLGGNCIFQDKGMKDVGENMAHETGHFLGCPDTYVASLKNTLMYGYTDVRGRDIPKGDANTMNP